MSSKPLGRRHMKLQSGFTLSSLQSNHNSSNTTSTPTHAHHISMPGSGLNINNNSNAHNHHESNGIHLPDTRKNYQPAPLVKTPSLINNNVLNQPSSNN